MDTPEFSENPYAAPGRNAIYGPPAVEKGPHSEIICEGVTSESEHVRAAMHLQKSTIRWLFVMFYFIGLSIGIGAAWTWFRTGAMNPAAPAWVVALLALPHLLKWQTLRSLRGNFRQTLLATEPIRRRINQESVHTITPTMQMVQRWEAFYAYTESEDSVMLRSAHNYFVCHHLYRSHFAPPDWEQFRNLVHS